MGNLIADRYQVVPPIDDGYAWWTVTDSCNNNYPLATFSIHLPKAGDKARALAVELNQNPAEAQT
jgi:hypothetical protein